MTMLHSYMSLPEGNCIAKSALPIIGTLHENVSRSLLVVSTCLNYVDVIFTKQPNTYFCTVRPLEGKETVLSKLRCRQKDCLPKRVNIQKDGRCLNTHYSRQLLYIDVRFPHQCWYFEKGKWKKANWNFPAISLPRGLVTKRPEKAFNFHLHNSVYGSICQNRFFQDSTIPGILDWNSGENSNSWLCVFQSSMPLFSVWTVSGWWEHS